MDLLFEKEGTNGSTELKSLLGFIDADIKFDKIKPDVITATNELVDLVGPEMYTLARAAYIANPVSDATLVYHMRYPIAIMAYSLLAPSNDIAHTANGRKMRQDENQKQAFEWMIDRDNQALQKRYYRAVDDLLKYLETIEAWKTTEAYKAVKRLFVNNTKDFDEHFRIQSRFTLLQLAPGMRQCEERNILPRIGRERFDALKTAVTTGATINDADAELIALIQEACVYHSLAWGMARLSVTIFPDGVLQAYTSDRETTQIRRPAVNTEVQAARQAFAADAASALERIEKLVAPVPVAPPPGCPGSVLPDVSFGTNYIST